MGVPADVAEVGVAVVADQGTVAVRPEERAVRRERLDAGPAERGDHRLDRVEEGRHLLGAAGVEGHLHPTGLVDAQLDAAGVDDVDPLGGAAEGQLLVEEVVTGDVARGR